MLLFSMGVSADGYTADREGGIGWTMPDEELFAFHLERVRGLGATLMGRRLYETMTVWETDPTFPDSADEEEFARVWTALPKVVFSRASPTLIGNARMADASLADEVAHAVGGTDKDVEIGGPGLAAQAIELDLVDEYRIFRYPVILGGGTPFFPALAEPLALSLVETRSFASGVVYECYRRAR